jgi:hypothetical protein
MAAGQQVGMGMVGGMLRGRTEGGRQACGVETGRGRVGVEWAWRVGEWELRELSGLGKWELWEGRGGVEWAWLTGGMGAGMKAGSEASHRIHTNESNARLGGARRSSAPPCGKEKQ